MLWWLCGRKYKFRCAAGVECGVGKVGGCEDG